MLHLSSAKILGKVIYFIRPLYPEIFKVCLAKFRFGIIPLANTTEENPGVGRFQPLPGARRVKVNDNHFQNESSNLEIV